ncbi:30S ribosomal protein S6--L-glutamate ligase [Gallaecimonas kandeliae]|uniref:30S ribosomal protein S6--L-glutamate ligase n=1 Tax=Gallaecimonas kandeliae TaxID=3029055 RepID=UPI002649CDCF|nr:30S ribosomal protein S6--L-glutamate ligase [Gallaecimonas kandeliae]WKE65416.1 30S ribosomal protein S6--L-glutamate ligase [Gallaecimonas kandeliae]
MRVAILSAKAELYSTQRLLAAAAERGMEAMVVSPVGCYMSLNSNGPQIHQKGQVLPAFDAVMPRVGPELTFFGAALLRQFEAMGVYTPVSAAALQRSRDKLRALQILTAQQIPMPVTAFAHVPDDIPDLIEMVGGAPLVLKLLEGSQGIGVVLAETAQAAKSVIEAFMGVKVNILVQEYIKESAGRDLRLLVVGDKVVAAMERIAKNGDFRANLHRGGEARAVKISPQERRLAVQAAKSLGLGIAGVDLLRSDRGPLVLEVNSSPGLEGIEAATGLDIAGIMMDHLIEHSRKRRKRDV